MVAMTVRDQDQVGRHFVGFDRRLGVSRQERVDQHGSVVTFDKQGGMPQPSYSSGHGRISSPKAPCEFRCSQTRIIQHPRSLDNPSVAGNQQQDGRQIDL